RWPVPPSSCCWAASCYDSPRSSRPRESTATASRRGCERARPPRNRPLAAARRGGVRQPRGHAGSRGRARRRPRQPRPRRPAARGRDDVLPDSLPHRESAMLWPLARPRRTRNVELQERLAQARRDNPEAEAWPGLLGAALDESENAARWMAAVPLLQACARGLASQIPASWWEGYCPVCGAWPVVAEYTGLERKRQLRCGRCGTGWAIPLLRCVFCDEIEHDNLAYLTPEEG